eukprot:scaffold151510_cov16-Tisochrysis_lutea.AAC.1
MLRLLRSRNRDAPQLKGDALLDFCRKAPKPPEAKGEGKMVISLLSHRHVECWLNRDIVVCSKKRAMYGQPQSGELEDGQGMYTCFTFSWHCF